MKKIEIETYRDMSSSYNINDIKKDEPSAINFLSYKKYKVTIEEIIEPKEVLIKRLKSLIKPTDGYIQKSKIESEIKRIEKLP